MEKSRSIVDRWLDGVDDRWRGLPIKKQHRYLLYFFIGYLLLTASVIFMIGYHAGREIDRMEVAPNENPIYKNRDYPALLRDSVFINFKNKMYEK